jgi:hypothetical protein
MLRIEFEEPRDQGPCPCCGGKTTSLTRFVYKDGDAHAVYLASYSDNHPEKLVSVAAGIGGWGDGTTPSDRVAFALQLQLAGENFAVTVVDGDSSAWSNAAFLGRSLSRSEALAHPLIKEAYHLTDHMVVEDRAIVEYLSPSGDA